MASTTKRLSRKELRQPDWFQSATENAFELYAKHRGTVFLGIGTIIIVLLGIWGWKAFKEREDAVAAREFGQAVTLYHTEKYREALVELEKVQTHRWSKYANLAHFYEANSHLALNDIAKAKNAAQRFIVGTDPNSLLRQLGLIGLATIEERNSQCREAIKHYTEAEKIKGPFTERAFLGEARCAIQLGDLQGGLAAYRQLLRDQSGSPSATYITLQVSDLEAKLAAQPAQK